MVKCFCVIKRSFDNHSSSGRLSAVEYDDSSFTRPVCLLNNTFLFATNNLFDIIIVTKSLQMLLGKVLIL